MDTAQPAAADNDFARHLIRYGLPFAPFVVESAKGSRISLRFSSIC